jgi:hypothetical protein
MITTHLVSRRNVAYLVAEPCISCIRCAAVSLAIIAVADCNIEFLSSHTKVNALAETGSGSHQLSHGPAGGMTSGNGEEET